MVRQTPLKAEILEVPSGGTKPIGLRDNSGQQRADNHVSGRQPVLQALDQEVTSLSAVFWTRTGVGRGQEFHRSLQAERREEWQLDRALRWAHSLQAQAQREASRVDIFRLLPSRLSDKLNAIGRQSEQKSWNIFSIFSPFPILLSLFWFIDRKNPSISGISGLDYFLKIFSNVHPLLV
jgi:hypothetical protein